MRKEGKGFEGRTASPPDGQRRYDPQVVSDGRVRPKRCCREWPTSDEGAPDGEIDGDNDDEEKVIVWYRRLFFSHTHEKQGQESSGATCPADISVRLASLVGVRQSYLKPRKPLVSTWHPASPPPSSCYHHYEGRGGRASGGRRRPYVGLLSARRSLP